MAFPNQNFFGSIEGRNIYSFLAELDYDLKTSTERVKHLKKILSDDKGNIHPFFERLFEQTYDNETKLNTSYIKLILNSTDGLYSDTNVCEVLTKMTDYVLFSEDVRELEKANKTEYKIYKDAKLFQMAMREVSLEAELEKIGGGDDGEKDIDGLIHILVKDKNFRKDTQQQIYLSDLSDEECGEILRLYHERREQMRERLGVVKSDMNICSNIIDYVGDKNDIEYQTMCQIVSCYTKEEASAKRVELSREMKMLIKQIALMKLDMEDVKDQIKKPIRFKHLMSGSTKGDYSSVDFGDIEILKECMKYPEQEVYDLQKEFDICLYTVKQLIEMTEFTVEEEQVLYLHQHGCSQKYIAEECSRLFGEEYIQQEVSRCLDDIAKKLSNTYYETLKKHLIKFKPQEQLKKCSKCGEIKLKEDFGKDSNREDGLRSECKKCRNSKKTK